MSSAFLSCDDDVDRDDDHNDDDDVDRDDDHGTDGDCAYHEMEEEEEEEEEEKSVRMVRILMPADSSAVSQRKGRRLTVRPVIRRGGSNPGTKLTIQLGLSPEDAHRGIHPGMELTMETHQSYGKRSVTSDRRIPGWAAGLLARLARDRPAVVTREDVEADLTESNSTRNVDQTVRELQRLGWLQRLHLKGVWAYVPPGEEQIIDPYIDIRGWRAREPDAVFALAGEAAAWHLGYLDRAFSGSVAVWVPTKSRLPHGLRAHLSIVTLGWSADVAPRLAPSTALLRRRRLDILAWASGLSAFGPEALVVQLSARPLSFRAWDDLVLHLDRLAEDCDMDRLASLLETQSSSTWQRAAYLLHCGNRHIDGIALLGRRPTTSMPKVQFGEGTKTIWSPDFSVVDHLVAPLQGAGEKA